MHNGIRRIMLMFNEIVPSQGLNFKGICVWVFVKTLQISNGRIAEGERRANKEIVSTHTIDMLH